VKLFLQWNPPPSDEALEPYYDEQRRLLFADHATLGTCVVNPKSDLATIIRGLKHPRVWYLENTGTNWATFGRDHEHRTSQIA